MNVTRRSFLAGSASGGLLCGSSALALHPLASARPDGAIGNGPIHNRRLVVVHLDGGNDGINTVIPHGDPEYRKLRPNLAIAPTRAHPLKDGLGLHPNMTKFKELWDAEQLCIVQGVGYPDSSRSHFEGTAIWESGVLDTQAHTGVGWLGSVLDAKPPAKANTAPTTDSVFIGSGGTPIAIQGRRTLATSLESLRDFKVRDVSALRRTAAASGSQATALGQGQHAFLSQVALGACDASNRLALVEGASHRVTYPGSNLARQLELAATLIGNDHPAQVYYVKQPGYDTHSNQRFTHGTQLTELSGSVQAFLEDVTLLGRSDEVVVMIFSEFGRTAKENGSQGTDHGTAGPVLLAGAPVRNGLQGATPDLGDLVDGEPKWNVDFRDVYAALATQWFGLPAGPAVKLPFGGQIGAPGARTTLQLID